MSKKKEKKYTKYELEAISAKRKKKTKTVGIIVGVLLIVWISIAVWDASANQPADTTKTGVDVSSVEDYLGTLN